MKTCTQCKKEKSPEEFYRNKLTRDGRGSWCKECQRRLGKQWAKKNRTKLNAYMAAYRKEKRVALAATNARRLIAVRDQGIAIYGGKCACCGEKTAEFLTISPSEVPGDGRSRRSVSSLRVWLLLKQSQWPRDWVLLCASCNQARSIYGQCPHERKEV